MPEWLKGADCKSASVSLRWFESISTHHFQSQRLREPKGSLFVGLVKVTMPIVRLLLMAMVNRYLDPRVPGALLPEGAVLFCFSEIAIIPNLSVHWKAASWPYQGGLRNGSFLNDLLTFTGFHDPFASSGTTGEMRAGPVLTVVAGSRGDGHSARVPQITRVGWPDFRGSRVASIGRVAGRRWQNKVECWYVESSARPASRI